jgi:DNA-binding FadR family transcriptional regulator
MVLPKVKRTTLVDRIVEVIITKINNKDFNVGEVLPSEIEMSEQFGVSRATIRESTSYLIGMGILKRNENGLEIVQSPSSAVLNNLSSFIDIGFETQSLYEARIFFDIGFAYLASLKASEEDIKQLEELNQNILSNLDNEESYWKTDLEFHYQIARISNNDFLFSIYEMIMQLFTTQLENHSSNIFNQKEVVSNTPSNHKNLINALKSGKSIDAINIAIKSLDKAMEDMISRRISQAIPNENGTKEIIE